jgi:hypothetical protein
MRRHERTAQTFRRAALALGIAAGFTALDCSAQYVPLILYGRVHVSVERCRPAARRR